MEISFRFYNFKFENFYNFFYKYSYNFDLKIEISYETSINFYYIKIYIYYGIYGLLKFRVALTIRFAKKTHHDMSEILRIPCKMKLCIFWKYIKNITFAIQNDFWNILKYNGILRNILPAIGNEIK